MADRRITLFYDGQCALCCRQIDWLRRRDRHGLLVLQDITDPAVHAEQYGLTQPQLMEGLHALLPDGRIVCRVEAIREACRTVGLGWIAAPTAWPVVGWLSDRFYDWIARHRRQFNRLFGGCNFREPP
jgi:predicted DCC family thiol-disulfide oxidoreductase YuxK